MPLAKIFLDKLREGKLEGTWNSSTYLHIVPCLQGIRIFIVTKGRAHMHRRRNGAVSSDTIISMDSPGGERPRSHIRLCLRDGAGVGSGLVRGHG
jgi:hypothetical protein